jgi:para-nitrobenzyl esterase
MAGRLAVLVLAALPLGQALQPVKATPVVRIDSGELIGGLGRNRSIRVFRGIPFAAPPVGTKRFRPPTAPAAWSTPRSADRFGAICPQLGSAGTRYPMDEDCLTLNVWTATAGPAKRAVLVWIYGGGFNVGHGSDPDFDGEALARKGIVVVTFNYRLGPFGFLATPELSGESPERSSGNYGLLDQLAALRWIQRNIAAFGGDPSRVTIAGQSAGAGSVAFLAMSPLARGLFRAGIAQSQVRHPRDPELRYLATSWRSRDAAEAAGMAFAKQKGAASAAELRALPWRALLEGSDAADREVDTRSPLSKPPLFRPVVDGHVVPSGYEVAFARGSYAPITFVAGNNLDESGAVPDTSFAERRRNPPTPRAGLPTTNVTLDSYRTWAAQKFGQLAGEFLALYPATTDDGAARASNRAMRDNSRVSTWLWGELWARTKRPLYTYYWTHAQPGPARAIRGAYHGSEISYVFNSLDAVDRPWTADDRRIAEVMSSYWVNIVSKGDPNGPGLPRWLRYDPRRPDVMTVGDRWGPMPVADPQRLAFWRRYFAEQTAW